MQIDGIFIKSFGRLKELDLTFAKGINLLYGLNEAGKSTLFNALSTLMLGFSPAKSELHPYAPWDSSALEIRGRLAQGDRTFMVQRMLKNAPSGEMTTGQTREKLANQPLPELKFINREVFNRLFALKLDNLNGELLKTKSWQEIKELYMFDLAKEPILSPSRVLNRLEAERNSLLRGDNRGNQRIKELQQEAKALRGQLKAALSHFESFEIKQQELKLLHGEHQTVQAMLQTMKLRQRQLEEALPQKALESKLQTLRDTLPKDMDLECLHKALIWDEQWEQLQQQQSQLFEQNQKEKKSIESLKSTMHYLTTDEEMLYNARTDILKLLQETSSYEDKRRQIAALDQELTQEEGQLQLLFLEAFQVNYDCERDVAVADLDLARISDGLRKIKNLNSEAATKSENKESPSVLLPISLVCLIALVSVLLFTQPMSLPLFGLTVLELAFSVAFAFAYWKQKNRSEALQRNTAAHRLKDETLHEICADLNEAIKCVIEPSGAGWMTNEAVIQHLIRIKGLVQHKQTLHVRQQELLRDVDSLTARIQELEERFGLPVPLMQEQLVTVERSRAQALADSEKMQYMQQKYHEGLSAGLILQSRIGQLETSIQQNTGMDIQEWKIKRSSIRNTLQKIDQINEELISLSHVSDSASQFDQTYETMLYEKLQLDTRIEQVQQDELRLYGDRRAAEKECEHLRANDTYHEIRDKLSSVELKLEEARAEHVRLIILIEVIRYADEQFKRLYQPEYLKKASFYFSRITGGKYTEIIINDLDEVILRSADQEIPYENMGSMSSGTLNQLYFSLYLSLIDMVDPEGVFPLFLDDVFLTWDQMRFESALHVVAELSQKRQIFLMSCNNEYSSRCSVVLDIKPIILA